MPPDAACGSSFFTPLYGSKVARVAITFRTCLVLRDLGTGGQWVYSIRLGWRSGILRADILCNFIDRGYKVLRGGRGSESSSGASREVVMSSRALFSEAIDLNAIYLDLYINEFALSLLVYEIFAKLECFI